MTRIGVLGSGEVGQTLARGLKTHGYEVRVASRNPKKLASFAGDAGIPVGSVSEVAQWAEAIVLAVPGNAAAAVLTEAGEAHLRGKVIVDVTNPISDEPPEDGVLGYFTGPNTSLMEALQAKFPGASFVKAFNSVGSALMVNPSLPGGMPTMFYCGNDPAAKAFVAKILTEFGWEPADMGGAVAARAIEPLAILWCIPGFRENDWSHAFRLLRS